MQVINIEHLSKNYGKHIGIKDVTFSLDEGEIFGFVGPNGAGKSTTIRILLSLIFADGGKASIMGKDCAKDSKLIKAYTGYVPSDVRLYEDIKVSELLRRNAGFYQKEQEEEAARLCKLFDLETGKRFRELSTGNKKKASLVCALASKPRILILDEPTSGLDPMVQKDLFMELKSQAAQGVTILLSSHNLAEVQEYCDRVAFIRDGKIIAVSDLAGAAKNPRKIISVYGGTQTPNGLELISEDGNKRIFRTDSDGAELLKMLCELNPDSFTVQHESIEERFMSLYREEKKQ
ncbi:MAG: ABC transporter ATP-binding protein [Clostridiaceae bacterium]|nr:ABC transporter ATP-binding protein [Clostridiaceae bacterium]